MSRRIAFAALCLVTLASSAVALEDRTFDSRGVKIHYIIEGQGEPVVLVHGFTASIPVQWGLPGIISKLAKQYQVVALDNRGHGNSDKPHDPDSYGKQMPEDVLRLMDHLKIKKAHVVGYSMGGFMTTYLLANHPDRLVTATLGGAGWTRPDDGRLSFMTELADSLDSGKGIGPLIEHLTPANRPKPTDEQIKAINQMLLLTNDAKALAACMRGMKGIAVTEEQLRASKVPTLCIIGSDDPLKVGVDDLAKVKPDITVKVIENTDHMTAFRSPEFVDDLLAFLGAHLQAKSTAAAGQ
jgi:pimeloyl-ACP methyl ester carboxylesterase